MKLTKRTIKEINGFKIIEFTGMGPARYKVEKNGRYYGKTSDGGYTTRRAAEKRAAA